MTQLSTPTHTTVLFDIDGTLVDSNYLHVDAWDRAFTAVGHPVDVWRVHRSIGMDSGMLLEKLLGSDAAALGERAKELHSRSYLQSTDRLRAFAGARELLAELMRREYTVVLATSAPQDELEILLDVVDPNRIIETITSAEDVGTAKPDPDIITTALTKADVDAAHAVMIGDSVWDVIAAKRAGVTSIGVLTGGFGREELLEAGAAEVYEDVAQLLLELDNSALTHG